MAYNHFIRVRGKVNCDEHFNTFIVLHNLYFTNLTDWKQTLQANDENS